MRYIISFLCATAALPALADVPRVITDIVPVHSLVAQVMGDLGQPELLLDAGADAHSFQLRPSQAAALQEAGLIVWIGPEMTPWLERALDGIAADVPRLGLLAAEGTFRQAFAAEDDGETGHDHDAADHDAADHDHAAQDAAADDAHAHESDGEGHDAAAPEDAHGEDEHDHSGTDPHAWLDPGNARHWLGLIAAELSRLDPENAATYAANAQGAQAAVTAVEAELSARLAPLQGKPFFVFHDAYGYFAGHFGLTVAGSVAEGDAADPGAARLAALRDSLAATPGTCLFPETQHDPAPVQSIVGATGVRLGAPLDPEGALVEPGPQAWGRLMGGLATALADCLGG